MSAMCSGVGFSGKVSPEVSGCNFLVKSKFKASWEQHHLETAEQSMIGGSIVHDVLVVNPQNMTLLKTKDLCPANDNGPEFLLLSNFLDLQKISPCTVVRPQITEEEFGNVQATTSSRSTFHKPCWKCKTSWTGVKFDRFHALTPMTQTLVFVMRQNLTFICRALGVC